MHCDLIRKWARKLGNYRHNVNLMMPVDAARAGVLNDCMMRRMLTIVLTITAAVALLACTPAGRAPASEEYRTGDLIFQDLDCGAQCDAIEAVTLEQFGVKEPRLSHVGIVIVEDGRPKVLEAYPPRVQMRPIEEVLARAQNSPARMVPAAQLKGLPTDWEARIKKIARRYIDRPYDNDFGIGDGAYYCSELVYEVFRELNGGREYFTLSPMYYGAAGSASYQVWKDYFETRGVPIPSGVPGISPLGIWVQVTEEAHQVK